MGKGKQAIVNDNRALLREKEEREEAEKSSGGTKRERSLDAQSPPLLVIYDSELAQTGVDPWLPTNGWE
ncbi:hypothetical protein K0M31_014278 [Melipona bicolor]|uniref:Uncharacterized protein n=1 Tax=Melipona bicolor TaxID=60889 RepID=A0AA40G8H7_9HYME|nr:hypothetical protein K0M31_014278 [Melipona bicolor]